MSHSCTAKFTEEIRSTVHKQLYFAGGYELPITPLKIWSDDDMDYVCNQLEMSRLSIHCLKLRQPSTEKYFMGFFHLFRIESFFYGTQKYIRHKVVKRQIIIFITSTIIMLLIQINVIAKREYGEIDGELG